ncbi:MAG: hypothetical protein M0P71_00870 [Melioribacteraceae bacterium]|nr:hypothetical protein [Melioribacteraceae bacterium]
MNFKKTGVYVNTKTQEQFNYILSLLESEKFKWHSGHNPLDKKNYWTNYSSETFLEINKAFGYGSVSNCSYGDTLLSFEQFINDILILDAPATGQTIFYIDIKLMSVKSEKFINNDFFNYLHEFGALSTEKYIIEERLKYLKMKIKKEEK